MKNYIIAEIGINHNGSMDLAKELIALAAQSGCDAVKFQKRDIDSVYSKAELDAPRESPWGSTNRDQKNGLEFSADQYKELKSFADYEGLEFIVSCWDEKSVDMISETIDVRYHKIASALLTDASFLKRVNYTGKPVILSTGMSTPEEVDAAVKMLDNIEIILACTSTYPTIDSELNLRYITTLKSAYPQLKVGFSNHSSGLVACFAAAAIGASCIEFHITKDRSMYGSDQPASIDHPEELVSGIRKIEAMLGDGTKVVYDSEKSIAKKLRKKNDILLNPTSTQAAVS